jgi:hypothetical protein
MASLNGYSSSPSPLENITTLASWWGFCGHMTLRAILAVAYATGTALPEPTDQGWWLRQKWIPWSSRLGVGRGANQLHPIRNCYKT